MATFPVFREQKADLHGVQPFPQPANIDSRGWLLELFRSDEPAFYRYGHVAEMGYVSATHHGMSRGPHEHRTQSDLFIFLGMWPFTLYLWDNRPDSPTYGSKTRREMPFGWSVRIVPGIVHAYRNPGDQCGWVVNIPDALYAGDGRRQPVDEIRYEEILDSTFQLWD